MRFCIVGVLKDTAYVTRMGKALRDDFGIHPADSFRRPGADLRVFAAHARKAGLSPLEAVFRLLSTLHQSPELQAAFPDWSEDRHQMFCRRAATLCDEGRIRASVYLEV